MCFLCLQTCAWLQPEAFWEITLFPYYKLFYLWKLDGYLCYYFSYSCPWSEVWGIPGLAWNNRESICTTDRTGHLYVPKSYTCKDDWVKKKYVMFVHHFMAIWTILSKTYCYWVGWGGRVQKDIKHRHYNHVCTLEMWNK